MTQLLDVGSSRSKRLSYVSVSLQRRILDASRVHEASLRSRHYGTILFGSVAEQCHYVADDEVPIILKGKVYFTITKII